MLNLCLFNRVVITSDNHKSNAPLTVSLRSSTRSSQGHYSRPNLTVPVPFSPESSLLQLEPDTPQNPKRPFAVCKTFETVLDGSIVVGEMVVVRSVGLYNALVWDSSGCMLASKVGSIVTLDMLVGTGDVESSRDHDVLCEDVRLAAVDTKAVSVDIDRLVRVSVGCGPAVVGSTSGLEAVTVMVTIGMDSSSVGVTVTYTVIGMIAVGRIAAVTGAMLNELSARRVCMVAV